MCDPLGQPGGTSSPDNANSAQSPENVRVFLLIL